MHFSSPVAHWSADSFRGCRCCCAVQIGMLAVFYTGLQAGEPERLLYGIDYDGLTCGVDNSKKPPVGFAHCTASGKCAAQACVMALALRA